jgi:hypothetical protein
MSEPISKENSISMVLDYIRMIASFWATQPNTDKHEVAEGVAFSILVLLDGCTNMPAFDLVLRPHPDDELFCKENNMDWFVDGMVINDDVALHELFCVEKQDASG